MGPPPKDTYEYDVYLAKQKERRQAKKKLANDKKLKQHPFVKGLVAAAIRRFKKLESQVDTAILRSNVNFRRAVGADAAKKLAKDQREKFEQQRLQHRDREKDLSRQLADKDKEIGVLQKQLLSWTTWWSRVECRAKPSNLKWLKKEFKRPPCAPDACWGGGQ